MSFVDFLCDVAAGAVAGVAVVTALPVAGAVGTITVAGASLASVAGGVAGAADYLTREG